jgi:membrane-associated phospholipid phosphatase
VRVNEQGGDRLPAFLSAPFLRTVGLVALVAVACEVLLLPRLVGLDAALWRVILYWRDCATDRSVDRVVELTTRAAIGLLIAAVLLRARVDGMRRAWPPLAVCLLGLYVGKLLKNVFARERPSMLSGAIVGYSFPSGHVMNTALAAIAIVVLAAAFRHPRRWRSAGLLMVVIIFLGRLLLAHHWLLDAVGGLLAAVALNGLALPVVRRRPLLAPALLAAAISVVLMIVTAAPRLKIHLPSPLSVRERDGVEVHVAEALGSDTLTGRWNPNVEHFRRGAYLWLEGEGGVTLTLPAAPDVARRPDDRPSVPAGWQASLAFGGRPEIRERRCLTARVSINGQALPAFVPFVGWREYRLLVPPGVLRAGRNDVRFEITDASGKPWPFAIVYVRLDLD